MQEKSKMHRPNIPYRDRLSVGATLAVAPKTSPGSFGTTLSKGEGLPLRGRWILPFAPRKGKRQKTEEATVTSNILRNPGNSQ